MSLPPDDAELKAILNPVWFNTYWVKNAIGLYEGITKHAAELDEHSHFFALMQQFSLDAAALGICKLFDRSNSTFKKNTVPELMHYLTTHFTDDYLVRVDITLLESLGLSHIEAKDIFINFRRDTDFGKAKADMISLAGCGKTRFVPKIVIPAEAKRRAGIQEASERNRFPLSRE